MAIGWHLVGKRPRLAGLERWMLAAGWACWTMALIGWMTYHQSLRLPANAVPPFGSVGVWIIPVFAGLGMLYLARRTIINAAHKPPREARELGEQFVRRSFLWLIVYDIGWLLGLGLIRATLVHGLLLLIALLINAWTYGPKVLRLRTTEYGLSEPASS